MSAEASERLVNALERGPKAVVPVDGWDEDSGLTGADRQPFATTRATRPLPREPRRGRSSRCSTAAR